MTDVLALQVDAELPSIVVEARRPPVAGRSVSPVFDDAGARERGFQRALVPGGGGRYLGGYMNELFRLDWFHSGRLTINHLKPVHDGDRLTLHALVRGLRDVEGGREVYLEVWAENDEGVRTTRGEATVVMITSV